MRKAPICVLVILLLFHPSAGYAVSINSVGNAGTEIVTTRHTIAVGGTSLSCAARAGFIPLIDKVTGAVQARIFFVSYTVERTRGMVSPRLGSPVAFPEPCLWQRLSESMA
jgi:hypothetical protein